MVELPRIDMRSSEPYSSKICDRGNNLRLVYAEIIQTHDDTMLFLYVTLLRKASAHFRTVVVASSDSMQY